ncbi:disease resistance protein RGA2 [Lathyrus oleraceus]|uniref:disease resistance protein RGA2 n=1 Tax=Pisum sativum TaxID=3888 RepID=UPI0021CEBFD5|nr:disease resistance protein RGA2-like [Pisum sativum]
MESSDDKKNNICLMEGHEKDKVIVSLCSLSLISIDRDLLHKFSLLTTIKTTLEDAEEKQFTDRAIKDWLLKLKDVAHVLDDILDECATQALEYEGLKERRSNKVQSSFLSCFHPKHNVFRYQIAKRMKRIRERLDEIAQERSKFHLTEIVREKRSGVLDWRQTTSIITQPQVYGREQDKDRIIEFLVGDASSFEDLSVYPIVGLGGLGKTTLAQLIFNHDKVVSHFELRIWVCVSEDFSLKRMTRAIIESATGHACAQMDLEPLQRKLLDLLKGKKYLLVLDDVWDDEQENWRMLKSVLACGGKGASILVTTRLLKVAAIMGTISPHDLSILSDTDCWELLKQRAFGPNEEEREELVVIGKEIVKKCEGVPLVAMALGSLLRFKREKIEWLNVKENKLWSSQGEGNVMSALRLSYLNLPVKLRPCFALCALFPKDEIINKKFLIDLWMTNGFISSNGMLEAEDIGNEVWNKLYWRSFFQDIEKDNISDFEQFKMHDLVHDLAQSIAEEVSYYSTKPSLSKRILHLSTYDEKSFMVVSSTQLHGIKSLRTFLTREYNGSPPQILKLDYCKSLQRLPDRLVQLKALQYLSLTRCTSLSSLPPHIRKMASLKTLTTHVVGKEKGFLLAELGQMNLKGSLDIKHLERVESVMDANEANMLRKQVNNLELEWEINEESQLQENVVKILEVLEPQTQQLQSLRVRGYTGAYFPQWMSSSSLNILTYLELVNCQSCLHLPTGMLRDLPSLKTLYIDGLSKLEQLPTDINNTNVIQEIYISGWENLKSLEDEVLHGLHSLKRLNIMSCQKFNLSESFQYLTCLENLTVQGCPEIEGLHEALQHMCALQYLSLANLPNLASLPDWLGNLVLLQTLEIFLCPKLIYLPTSIQRLTRLKRLEIYDCSELGKRCRENTGEDWHKIAHIQVNNR